MLINGWATWCPPCKAEGFELLAVNSGESRSVVQPFIEHMGFTFSVLLDTNKDVLDGLGVSGLPTSIFVGRDGAVKTIHVGGLPPNMIEQQLTPLLSQ